MSYQKPFTSTLSFSKHPNGLATIFFTEMWERFGYYDMRALLILYMTKTFLFSDAKAYSIYGAFTAFVYITPALLKKIDLACFEEEAQFLEGE